MSAKPSLFSDPFDIGLEAEMPNPYRRTPTYTGKTRPPVRQLGDYDIRFVLRGTKQWFHAGDALRALGQSTFKYSQPKLAPMAKAGVNYIKLTVGLRDSGVWFVDAPTLKQIVKNARHKKPFDNNRLSVVPY